MGGGGVCVCVPRRWVLSGTLVAVAVEGGREASATEGGALCYAGSIRTYHHSCVGGGDLTVSFGGGAPAAACSTVLY